VLSILAISLLGAIIVVLTRAASDVAKRRQAEEGLRKARTTLEQRVKDRTAELVETNEQLKQEIDERKQMEEKLWKSGERFRALTESTSDWIWELNAKGIYTYASPKVKDLLGYEPGEVIGKTPFDFMPPDEAKRIKLEFNAIVDSQKPFSKLENVNTHKDGRLIVLETSGVPIFDHDGRLYGYRGIDRDITKEKKLRRESEYRLQQVIHADKLSSLGEVVAGVAHEINNPNSFITYNVPLLEETWQMFEPLISKYAAANSQLRIAGFSIEELCADMRELLQEIKIGSDRINKIVSNLKDFARLDENTQFKPVQVNEMIEKTMAIVGAQVRKSIGKVKINLDPDLPRIQGQFQKLEQVMANLVINAVQAAPDKGKGKLSISTRHVTRLGSVLIEVEDNGTGIESGVIERVFEPFFTTRRDAGGTGLGLSVSYGLIQEHNGIIGVLSIPGLGTRFTVYLPVDGKKKPDLGPSILCLDDDAEFLGLLNLHSAQISKIPMETIEKSNGIMEYLENHPEVDIVLSNADSKMFGANGWKLTEKIKTRFPLIAIILYSSDVNAVKQRPDCAPGPDHILEKPFTIEHLFDIINTIDRQRL
jgi:PAS domain S-box-containing protein